MLIPLLLAAPMITCSEAQAAPVTTRSLIHQMTDLAALAQFPDPPYKTTQFSSYDRRSVAPYAPEWYANSDGFGNEPIPGFEATLREPGEDGLGTYLMADVRGPGAIARTWTATINGEVAVFLDGNAEPLFKGSAADFLGKTYSTLAMQAGFIAAPIGEGFRQSEACYFPIPFAKSLRIEWTGRLDQLHFYHIEVRHYPEGTPVETFSLDDLSACSEDIRRALQVLREPQAQFEHPTPGQGVGVEAVVEPDGRAELARIDGPAAVQELTLQLKADDLHQALRQVILKGYFDGAQQPQIEVPIGDFFGSGPGLSPLDTLPTTVGPDGTMTCRFLMPFKRSAVFVALNLGSQQARITGSLSTRPYDWQEDVSMHFHAKWRVDHSLVAAGGDEAFDVPYICARGKGVLVGVAAMLLNPAEVPTSGGNWWGEGDEKIWVDEDTFPSLFGTGSEDYFNYAWSRPALFDHAYCAQPLTTGPDNRGFVSNSRWHILDALPFESRIDFFMELLHHGRIPDFSYARLACFYATPQVRDDHIPITRADVTQGLELPADWRPKAAGAARGAIFYQAEDLVATEAAHVSILQGRMWSAGKLVNWTPTAEGDRLDLKLTVDKPGRYQVALTAALTPSSGRLAVCIDGGEPMEPVADLFTPHHTMLRNVHFTTGGQRTIDIESGEHTITVISRGKSEDSAGTDIGLDFLWLIARE